MMDCPSGLQTRIRLDNLIKSSRTDNYASISALIGKNHAYIQQYITRGTPRQLSVADQRTIARHFDVPETELGIPESNDGHILPAASPDIARGPGDNDHLLVNAYDLSQLANHHSDQKMVAKKQISFHRSWLPADTEVQAPNLAIFNIKGDSMSPTLNEGSHILVDLSSALPAYDGIYVLKIQDSVHVKRVSINPVSGRVSIRSDNPMYENWPGCAPERINFVGRVIWVGTKI